MRCFYFDEHFLMEELLTLTSRTLTNQDLEPPFITQGLVKFFCEMYEINISASNGLIFLDVVIRDCLDKIKIIDSNYHYLHHPIQLSQNSKQTTSINFIFRVTYNQIQYLQTLQSEISHRPFVFSDPSISEEKLLNFSISLACHATS